MVNLSQGNIKEIRLLLEICPDAMLIINTSGKIVLSNTQVERLFGFSAQELEGKTIEDLMPEKYRSVHPKHRSAFFEKPRVREMGTGLELFGLKKDKTEVPIEISLNSIMIKNEIFAAAAIRDVTARKQSEQKFRGLLEAAPNAQVIANKMGEILLVNAQTEKLFGYTKSELLGQKVEMLLPERFRKNHPKFREEFSQNPKTRPMGAGSSDLFGLKKDATEFPVEISLSPLKIGDELIIISSIRDITVRKETEKALESAKQKAEQSAKELEAFSYSVAHDLRAPLRAIEGFSYILKTDFANKLDSDGLKYFEKIIAQTGFMSRLIDDLLQLAKVSRSSLEREEVNLTDVIEASVQRMQVSYPERITKFEIEKNLHVSADSKLLKILLDNLIGNAAKYSSKNPNALVKIGSRIIDNNTVFYVNDNGVGFDMKYYDKLFGVFQRLHTQNEFDGTGIGLATAQRVVHRHEGRIWAEGTVNHGATFYFTLRKE